MEAPPSFTPLPLFAERTLKELVELPESCSEWRNVPVAKALDGGLVLYYKNKEIRIPREMLDLAANGQGELQSLALEGLLSRALGKVRREEFICLLMIISRLGMKQAEERLKKDAVERLRSRTPSLSAILAKVTALEMGKRYSNHIAVDPSTGTIYFRQNGVWIWGSKAEAYLKAKAFEIANSLVEEIASQHGVELLKAKSAVTSSVAEEALKQLTLWCIGAGRDALKMLSGGSKYIAVGSKVIDIDSWFKHGVFKTYDAEEMYDVIVIHNLPQEEEFVQLPNVYEGLEDIEAVAEEYTPLLLQAMREWVPNELDRLNLWMAMGYAIYPKMPFRNFFLIVGPTSSGKSTFLDFLSKALGRQNISSVTLGQLLGQKSEYYTAELFNKLANLADEGINSSVLERKAKSLEMLKALVGGSYITARRPYSAPFMFVNYAKLFFVTNDEKTVELLKQDPAVAKRMVVVKFKGSFRDNQAFKERLLKEANKALPVLLVALRVLAKKRGFVRPLKPEELLERVKLLCRERCEERRKRGDLFLSAKHIREELDIPAVEVCKALRESGVQCIYAKAKGGKRGVVLPKDFLE